MEKIKINKNNILKRNFSIPDELKKYKYFICITINNKFMYLHDNGILHYHASHAESNGVESFGWFKTKKSALEAIKLYNKLNK